MLSQEHDLRATPVPGNTKRRLSAHFTLHSSHFTLHTSHLHFALHTSSHLKACELFSPHLSSSHLIPSLLTCHQSKFNCFHLIRSPINLSHLPELFSTHLSCSARQKALTVREKSLAHKKTLGAENTNTWDTNVFRQKKPFGKYFVLQSLHKVLSQYYFVVQSLHKVLTSTTLYYKACTDKALPSTTLYYEACTNHFPALLCTTKLAQSTSQYYFVLQTLHKAFPSTTLYYKACTKRFPVLLCTTKLAQSTSQVLLCTTKACTNYSPVLLCTTKLAQSLSQYYFVLQTLAHKLLPSTTVYYKACTKYFPTIPNYKACTNYFPVLLCTTKLAQTTSQYKLCTTTLAQSTSQYYFALQSLHKLLPSTYCALQSLHKVLPSNTFVLQSLHKVLPSTTLYYKACTKYFPVLLCSTKLAQSPYQYYFVLQSLHRQSTSQYYFVLRSLHKPLPSTTL